MNGDIEKVVVKTNVEVNIRARVGSNDGMADKNGHIMTIVMMTGPKSGLLKRHTDGGARPCRFDWAVFRTQEDLDTSGCLHLGIACGVDEELRPGVPLTPPIPPKKQVSEPVSPAQAAVIPIRPNQNRVRKSRRGLAANEG